MKRYCNIFLFVLFPLLIKAQGTLIDSLRNNFQNAPDGGKKFEAARFVYTYYEELNRDSALYYAEQSLLIAQHNHHKIAEGYSLVNKGYQLMGLGRYAESLQCLLQAFSISEDKGNDGSEDWDLSTLNFKGNNRLFVLSSAHHIFAILMLRTDNTEQQIIHFKEAERIGREINFPVRILLSDMNLGQSYLTINKPDSALYYEKEAEQITFQSGFKKYLGNVDLLMGDIYQALNNQPMALQYYYAGVHYSIDQNNLASLSRVYWRLSQYHLLQKNADSALYYSKKNLEVIQSLGPISGTESNIGLGYEYVYLSYKLNHQFDSAFKYQSLALIANDSIFNVRIKNLTDFQNLSFKEQLRLQNVEKEKIAYQNKIRTYFFIAGIGVLLLLSIIFYRNSRQKHRANKKIEKAYEELKATQQQLIQSEKMASLGELTAGIAHEIQNPLNFVNNFSDVNNELIEELKSQKLKLKTEEQDEILNDIFQNNEKIIFHGKRAEAIVKGMLQHSRTSSGQKEPTDINALCDEYLRLSYHGLRAKDKSFNAKSETHFDDSIGKVNIVPQEIGRVILNLINNAFYAASQPSKGGLSNSDSNKIPTVWVSTKKDGNKILISVRDNGPGIPESIKEKIFQPFFTTKPTGQGTGLGLSLSYDIIKAHGGEIKVESKEGEGTTFIVTLAA
jgi:two-component system NtrC family sensor kinase